MSTLEVQGLGKRFPVRGDSALRREIARCGRRRLVHAPARARDRARRRERQRQEHGRAHARAPLSPERREILFDGDDVSDHRRRETLLEYRSQVQMIFQDPFASLNPVKRIDHHIARPLQIHGICPRGALDGRVRELLAARGTRAARRDRAEVGPCSTIRPRYITSTSSAT